MLGKPGQRDVPDGEACLCVGSPEQMHRGCSMLLFLRRVLQEAEKRECRAALFLHRYLNMDVLKKIYKGQQKEKNYGCD